MKIKFMGIKYPIRCLIYYDHTFDSTDVMYFGHDEFNFNHQEPITAFLRDNHDKWLIVTTNNFVIRKESNTEYTIKYTAPSISQLYKYLDDIENDIRKV